MWVKVTDCHVIRTVAVSDQLIRHPAREVGNRIVEVEPPILGEPQHRRGDIGLGVAGDAKRMGRGQVIAALQVQPAAPDQFRPRAAESGIERLR